MDNLFSTLTGYAGCQYDAPHAEGLKCPAILLSCDKRIVQEENSPPPGRFLVENMMTKTQPDRAEPGHLFPVISLFGLGHPVFVFRRTPVSPYLAVPWHSPSSSVNPKEVRGRGPAVVAPGWVRSLWHLCMTSLSMQPEGCCQSCLLLPFKIAPRGCMAACHRKTLLS